MRNGVHIGLIAVAMGVAIAGRGCVTAPPPVSRLVAGDDATPGSATQKPNTPTPTTTQTANRRRAALDKQLDDSLGSFDAHLHEEQQKTAEERDARQATVSATTTAAADAPEASAGSHGGAQHARGDSKASH